MQSAMPPMFLVCCTIVEPIDEKRQRARNNNRYLIPAEPK